MARRVPDDRLEQLVAVASRVFIAQGYAKTQMADVATALGVATGTVYLYVESKAALFDLLARYADVCRPLAKRRPLPFGTPRSGPTAQYVRELVAQGQVPPTLTRALAQTRAADVRAEFEAIVRELYDTLAANRSGIKLLDRSARDFPELAAVWFEGARGGLITLLTQYLDERVRRRVFWTVPDTTVAARLIIETATFWAVHRHTDPHPQAVEEAVAKETVVQFLTRAF